MIKKGVVLMEYSILFFFFQAEDGIRDVAVTGVQTCALPIYTPCDDGNACTFNDVCDGSGQCDGTAIAGCTLCSTAADCDDQNACTTESCDEIGRASCRERV